MPSDTAPPPAADPVELVTQWFRRLEHGDPAPELCHPQIEIRNWDESPAPGPYHGHTGLRQWWTDLSDSFKDVALILEEAQAVDHARVVTKQRLRGRFRATEIDLDWLWSSVVTLREGKVASATGYQSPKGARRAIEG